MECKEVSKDNVFDFDEIKKLYKEKRYREALLLLRGLLSIDPENIKYKFWYAKVISNYDEFVEEAKSILYELTETTFKEPALLELARIYSDLEHFDSAQYQLDQLMMVAKSIDIALVEQGKLALKQGNKVLAQDCFENIIGSPYKKRSILQIIYGLLREGKPEEALLYYNKLLTLENCSNVDEFLELKTYIDIKLGVFDNQEISSYFLRQAISYDKEAAIKKTGRALYRASTVDVTYFNKFFDYSRMFQTTSEVVEGLSFNPHYYSIHDSYVVKRPVAIGCCHGDPTNKFIVTTLHGTSKILAMYPVITSAKGIRI